MSTQNTETAGDRLKMFRYHQDITGGMLAETLGVSKAAISHWESGRAEVSQTVCLALAYVYGVSPAWLLHGKGPMFSRQDVAFVADPCGGDSQILMVPMLPGLGSFNEAGTPIAPFRDDQIKIPILASQAKEALEISGGGEPEDLFFVEQAGNSMHPLLFSGDAVLISTAEWCRLHPVNGQPYLVRRTPDDQTARVRRVTLSLANRQMTYTAERDGNKPMVVSTERYGLGELILGQVILAHHWVLPKPAEDSDWE